MAKGVNVKRAAENPYGLFLTSNSTSYYHLAGVIGHKGGGIHATHEKEWPGGVQIQR